MSIFNDENRENFMRLFHSAIEGTEKAHLAGTALLKNGIVFVEADGKIMESVPYTDAELAIDLFGYNNEIWSASFHKSWDVVATKPIEELVFEQIVHYFSTYGLESLGLEANPIIPFEKVLTDPATMPNVKGFTVIRTVSEALALDMIKDYLAKTVSPHRDKVEAIVDLMRLTDVAVDDIKSFELKIARHDQLGTVPTQGQDFLRFVVYKLTGKTTLVKDKETINALKGIYDHYGRDYRSAKVYEWLVKANEVELAKVFHRFKPLFLALKKREGCAPIINRVRRLADKYHEPCSGMTASNIMSLICQDRIAEVQAIIAKADVRTTVKLMNFAASRLNADTIQIYNIRNGKIFVNSTPKTNTDALFCLYIHATQRLQQLVANKFKGNIYYIPEYISYATPISEKQFIGCIPYGTKVDGGDNAELTAAIHWENYRGERTDLDLHMSSATEQFGWNSSYRREDRQVLYSGDMTDAKNGAVEAFKFVPNEEDMYLLSVNNFTAYKGVPFEFFMTNKGFTKNINRDNHADRGYGAGAVCEVADAIFPPVPLKFSESNAQSIGFFYGSIFTFYGGDLGASIVPKHDMYADALEAIRNRCWTILPLEALIELGGGIVVHNQEEVNDYDEETQATIIDLSPMSLNERTLLDLVD